MVIKMRHLREMQTRNQTGMTFSFCQLNFTEWPVCRYYVDARICWDNLKVQKKALGLNAEGGELILNELE
jgi:hypothetical protein